MARYILYPAVGQTVLDENGNTIPPQGGGPYAVNAYYEAKLLRGLLLRTDPLASGEAPILPPGPASGIGVTVVGAPSASGKVLKATSTTQATWQDEAIPTNLTTGLAGRPGVIDGEVVLTVGHTAANDGGGADFRFSLGVSSGADGYTKINCANGQWELVRKELINARWFGATPTIARINRAINYASSLGGGEVFVPAEPYTNIGTNSVLVRSNVDVTFERGCTMTTGVIGGHSYVISANTLDNSTIENARIIGNGLRITGDAASESEYVQFLLAVNIQDPGDVVRDITFSDIVLIGANTDGLSVGGNPGVLHERVTFDRITTSGCRRCGGSSISGSDVRFVECHFDDNGGGLLPQDPQCGFDIENDAVDGSQLVTRDLKFERCTFSRNAKAGLLVTSPSYSLSGRTLVFDCEANDNGWEGFVSQQDDVILSRCRAYRNGKSGFYVTGGAQVGDCLSRDNTIAGYFVVNSGKVLSLMSCLASFNGLDGFLINSFAGSTGVTSLTGCHAFGNLSRGMNLSEASNASINGGSCVLNRQEGLRMGKGQNNAVGGTMLIMQNGVDADASAAGLLLEDNSHANHIGGVTLRQSPNFLRSAAVVDATYTTLTTVKLGAHASPIDDAYNGMYARIISGAESGPTVGGFVTDYDGTNRAITVAWDSPLGGLPDATSIVTLVGGRLFSGTVKSATSTTVVLSDDFAPDIDSALHGFLRVTFGEGIGQIRAISGYVGSTRTLTVTPAMSPVTDETSVIEIIVNKRPLYGIRVTATCSLNLIRPNDCYYAGTSSGFSDLGTSNTTDANRVA